MNTIIPSTSQLRMLATLRDQQWMIRPDLVQSFALGALEAAEKSGPEKRADSYWEQFYTLRRPAFIDGDGIAHIEIRGALLNKCPQIYEYLGLATRYPTIIAETQAAVEQGAKAILYHVDSPGGTVSGVIEAGEAIVAAGVPTAAHCSNMACSAGYWLPAGTGAIIADPSAEVGNVGAIVSWADCDEFWAMNGITFKALVSDGADLKSTFHLEPDEKQTAFLQDSINAAGARFRDHVATGRQSAGADLDPEVWRAGWYSGERAGALGLIDGIGTAENAAEYLKSQIS